MTELKPCPFCGGEVELVREKGDEFEFVLVSCKNCDATIGIGGSDNEQKVIEAWNTRPNPWHTGTPTEEGLYLICSPSWDMFPSKYNVAEFDGKDFVYAEGMHQIVVRTNPTTVAWQKIEPYKEN